MCPNKFWTVCPFLDFRERIPVLIPQGLKNGHTHSSCFFKLWNLLLSWPKLVWKPCNTFVSTYLQKKTSPHFLFIFLQGYEENEDDISNFDEDLDYIPILDDPLEKRSGGWKLRAGKRGSWKLRAGKRDPLLALKRNWKLRAGKRSYYAADDEDQIAQPQIEDLNTFFKRKFWKLRSMKRARNDWKFRSGKREAMWKLRAGKRSMEDV